MITITKRTLKIVATTITTLCLIILFSWIIFLSTPLVTDEQGFKYTVAPGASLKSVVNDLYSLNVIKHPALFNFLVYLKGGTHELKAGEYFFQKGTRPTKLLKQIVTGSGMVYHTLTIVAGWNFRHLRDVLDKDPNLQHASTAMSDAAIMQALGSPGLMPEGWFYPDTYYFIKGSTDLALLKRSFHLMQKKLNNVWKKRELGLPYQTQEEVLTVASLVEKETALDKERPVIAGVIANRLRKNMLLQIDPTVIYAIGKHYNGIIYKTDLSSDSPYNTYKHKGLPPTPIAIPGMVSIQAAMHPQHHNFYYFVARNATTAEGGHQFSETLAEHYQAIAIAKQNQIQSYFNDYLINSYLFKQLLMTMNMKQIN